MPDRVQRKVIAQDNSMTIATEQSPRDRTVSSLTTRTTLFDHQQKAYYKADEE
jgi:hypothetical protein